MHKLRALMRRLMGAGWTKREFEAELESQMALDTAEGVRAGVSEQEARRQALIKLGGAEQARQSYRERATLPLVETLRQDVRYALRGFRRNPIFALTAIVTLTLGIGATTAVFSVVDRILFRAPYAHDDRLVSFGLSQSLEPQEFTLGGFFYEWRDNQKPFESVTFERGVGECNLMEQNPVQLRCASVAANFLPTLGISPQLGRSFLPEEDVPGGAMAAIISNGLWLSRYNRDPGVLNRSINLDGREVRIIGVLPRDFEMPRLQETDILLPAQTDIAAQHTVNSGIGYPMWAFARLKPGVTIAEAKAEMDPLFRHTYLWIPPQIRSDFHLQVRSVRDRQMQDASQSRVDSSGRGDCGPVDCPRQRGQFVFGARRGTGKTSWLFVHAGGRRDSLQCGRPSRKYACWRLPVGSPGASWPNYLCACLSPLRRPAFLSLQMRGSICASSSSPAWWPWRVRFCLAFCLRFSSLKRFA
jgi:hypothetical protein